MIRKIAALFCILIFFVSLAFASFPGVSFNLWVDFEGLTNGSSPTTTQLASSSHCSSGCGSATWAINGSGNVTGATSAQCPLSGMGDTGSLGLQYSSSTGLLGNVNWTLPSAVSAASAGMCFHSEDFSNSVYNFCEMDHFFTFDNFGFGTLWRASSERSGADNTRQIRLSAGNNRIPISDLTWYWVTIKYVKGGTVSLAIYNITGGVIGTQLSGSPITDTDTDNATVTDIFIGNQINAGCAQTETSMIDNVVIDTSTAVFPLLPTNATPGTMTFGPSIRMGPSISQ